jgi:hypothetical protein
MANVEQRIFESTRQISRLYHDRVSVNETVKLMRDRNISADLVKAIYNEFSTDAEKTIADRFDYYTIRSEKKLYYYNINYWTSRYLLIRGFKSADSHEIQIIDVFNDKSM